MQKVKVTFRNITCKGLDDAGDTEELYGKVWALNMSPYRNIKTAKQYFDDDEIIKIGNGGGEIWRVSRDNYLAIRKNEMKTVGRSVFIMGRKNDDIIILGDLDERDLGWRNPDDKLNSSGTISHKVVNLASFEGTYIVTLRFKSGGTDIWLDIAIEKIY